MSEITRVHRLYRKVVIRPLARLLYTLGYRYGGMGVLGVGHAIEVAPRRLLCRLTGGHRWDNEPDHVMTSGPLQVPPAERDYEYLGSFRQCTLCYATEEFTAEPGEIKEELVRYRTEAEEEWADPDIRAALQGMGAHE